MTGQSHAYPWGIYQDVNQLNKIQSWYEQGTGFMAKALRFHCLSMFGDVCGAGGISLSPAATLGGHRCPTGPWVRLCCSQAPGTPMEPARPPSSLPCPFPGDTAGGLVTYPKTQSITIKEPGLTKTDFARLCCSLQVGKWPSISKAMLTSAARNQNYGTLPEPALTWPGSFDGAGTAPPRCKIISVSPHLAELGVVPPGLQARAWRDSVKSNRVKSWRQTLSWWLGRDGGSVPTPGSQSWCVHPKQHRGFHKSGCRNVISALLCWLGSRWRENATETEVMFQFLRQPSGFSHFEN